MSPALTLATGVRVLQKVWHDHRTVALMLIAFSVNLLGDWLRDALNPRLL